MAQKIKPIKKLNGTTYAFAIGDVNAEGKEYYDDVVVGGLNPALLEPKVNLTRWKWGRHPADIEITLKTGKNEINGHSQVGEKIKLEAPKFDFNVYGRERQPQKHIAVGERGELEIELVLKEKPTTNVFEWDVTTPNLEWFYQAPLTQEDIDGRAYRPDNVVGSYVVYHATSADAHKDRLTTPLNVKNFGMNSKAFHVYRPEAIDANGVTTWCELHYQDAVLSVTVPQQFLDAAVYPVTVDPTFGYTTLGGSLQVVADSFSDDQVRSGNAAALSEAGTCDKITVGLKMDSAADTIDHMAFINREDAVTDSHAQVVGIEILELSLTTTTAWYAFTASSESLTADDYVLNITGNGTDVATFDFSNVAYDSTGSRNVYTETFGGTYASSKEDPWTETNSAGSRYYSIYVTYTVAGGPSASISPSVSPSISPSVSPSVSPSASISPSVSPSVSPSASVSPSVSPSISPSVSPSVSPSSSISASVSPSISASVSPSASISPSVSPSISPSVSPSASVSPSISPSVSPSVSPSASISSSVSPSTSPSVSPSVSPSSSISASVSPSISPSESPSVSPSSSLSPSISPSISPSVSPSVSPSSSISPSVSPSISPSESPSVSPSASISSSVSPSISSSESPSVSPSASISPSISPSVSPSASLSPSISPSESPSVSASVSPSASLSPSISPSVSPSSSLSPSISPSISPSVSPSIPPPALPLIMTDWGPAMEISNTFYIIL